MNLYWKSLDDFLAMGGYAPYVWASFGVVALCIAIELIALRLGRKALVSQFAEDDDSPS
jgi:heme exporter protein D